MPQKYDPAYDLAMLQQKIKELFDLLIAEAERQGKSEFELAQMRKRFKDAVECKKSAN